jgi:hypothetical protein
MDYNELLKDKIKIKNKLEKLLKIIKPIEFLSKSHSTVNSRKYNRLHIELQYIELAMAQIRFNK